MGCLSFLIVIFKDLIYHLTSFQSFATCSKAPGSSDSNLNSQTGRALQIYFHKLDPECSGARRRSELCVRAPLYSRYTNCTANNYGALCYTTSKWTQCERLESQTRTHLQHHDPSNPPDAINKGNVVQAQNISVNWIDLFSLTGF